MQILNLIKSHKPVFSISFCVFTLCCRIIYKLSCFSHWFEATLPNAFTLWEKGQQSARMPAGTATCFHLFLCTYTSPSSAWAPATTPWRCVPLLQVCDLKTCSHTEPVPEEQRAQQSVDVTPNQLQPCGWGHWLSLTALSTCQSFSLRKPRDKYNDNWYFIDVK